MSLWDAPNVGRRDEQVRAGAVAACAAVDPTGFTVRHAGKPASRATLATLYRGLMLAHPVSGDAPACERIPVDCWAVLA